MAMGYNSYFVMREEGTQLGTEATSWGVDSGLFTTVQYFNSESLAPENEQKFLNEVGRSGVQDRGMKRFRQHGLKAGGNVEFFTYPEGGGDKAGIGLLLKHVFGSISSGTYSGAGTYLHQFVPQDDIFTHLAAGTKFGAGTGRVYGISVHIGREDDSGTIRDYPFLGNRIKSLAFACAAGEELKCTTTFMGRVAKPHGTALGITSYPTMSPFMWKDALFQIGVNEAGAGGTERTIDSFSISIDNNLKEVWTLGTNVLGRIIPNGQRNVTGEYTVPFYQWVRTEYDKWVAGTPSSLNMAFTNGAYRLEFRCPNVYYTGKAPNIGSMDETIVSMPFTALVSTNFDLKCFLVNTDSQIGFSIV